MKNDSPFFSVVVPVYNKSKHIEAAFDSIRAQTFKSFEVIVVCDPSTDDSTQLVEAYDLLQLKTFYRDQPGPGGYAARNKGIEESSGEWVAFLDADDEWDADHLTHLYQAIVSHQNIKMVGASWLLKKNSGVLLDKFSRFHSDVNEPIVISLENYLKNANHGKRPIHTSVACIQRTALEKLSPAFIIHPDVKRGGDLMLWLKCMCAFKEMVWTPHVGAVYSLDADNMVTKSAPSKATLMDPTMFASLAKELSVSEKKLLVRYLNRWVRNDWRSNVHRGCQNFSLCEKLYWKQDFLYSLITFLSLSVSSLLRIDSKRK